MVKFAEEECATCHAIRPKNEMREVKVERVIGRSYGDSKSSRSGNKQYNSFSSAGKIRFGSGSSSNSGQSSRSNIRTRIERVWVCLGCSAPRSDGWLGRLVSKAAIAGVLGWLALNLFMHQKRADTQKSKPETSRAVEINRLENLDGIETKSSIKALNDPKEGKSLGSEVSLEPAVIFAPPQEVVQKIPDTSEDNAVSCSDNCLGN